MAVASRAFSCALRVPVGGPVDLDASQGEVDGQKLSKRRRVDEFCVWCAAEKPTPEQPCRFCGAFLAWDWVTPDPSVDASATTAVAKAKECGFSAEEIAFCRQMSARPLPPPVHVDMSIWPAALG